MKKLAIILILCSLTGCSNPIASAVDKEGDETRAQMQTELEIAKQQISTEMRKIIETLKTDFGFYRF